MRAGPLPYLPASEAAEIPNVMADGAPMPSTVLSLSHWPVSPTPAELAHDLSAGSGFAFLDSKKRWPAAGAITTDHYDQDGLVTVFAVSHPELARPRRRELLAVAEAGDFAVADAPEAARVAFALASLGSFGDGAGSSPLDGSMHGPALGHLVEWVDDPDCCRSRWEDEEAFVTWSDAALDAGRFELSERPDLDLAVVAARAGLGAGGMGVEWRQHWEFTHRADSPLHPVALYRRIAQRFRVLFLTPPRYELRFRYETWVRLASRRPMLRPDVLPLAERLSAMEPEGQRWNFTGAASLVPRLAPAGPSALAPEDVLAAVVEELGRARPGWDPYGGLNRAS
jgi:hypothetical protein